MTTSREAFEIDEAAAKVVAGLRLRIGGELACAAAQWIETYAADYFRLLREKQGTLDALNARDAEIAALKDELAKRNKSPADRLHNICRGLEEDRNESPFTPTEWDRIDAENTSLRNEIAALKADAERMKKAIEEEIAHAEANCFHLPPRFGQIQGELAVPVQYLRAAIDAQKDKE